MFHFEPELREGVWTISWKEHHAFQHGDFLYLGQAKEQIRSALSDALSEHGGPGNSQSRAPIRVIDRFINDESLSGIGGDLQLGIANVGGFTPVLRWRPRSPGKSGAFLNYLGGELSDELTYVGSAKVGMVGLA
jgi:hypothetical protein